MYALLDFKLSVVFRVSLLSTQHCLYRVPKFSVFGYNIRLSAQLLPDTPFWFVFGPIFPL